MYIVAENKNRGVHFCRMPVLKDYEVLFSWIEESCALHHTCAVDFSRGFNFCEWNHVQPLTSAKNRTPCTKISRYTVYVRHIIIPAGASGMVTALKDGPSVRP